MLVDLTREEIKALLGGVACPALPAAKDKLRAALDQPTTCTTFDCDKPVVASVEIEGEWCRYCPECAEVLERSGDPTHWDGQEASRAS